MHNYISYNCIKICIHVCRSSDGLAIDLSHHDFNAQAVLQGLRRLDALPGPVAARSIVELLAATLPVPSEHLLSAFDSASVSPESLRRTLQQLGVELQGPAVHRAVVRYSLLQRLYWRCRWLSLKACGAVGAGCCWGLAGLITGICMGGVAAVPSRAWPEMQVGDEPTVLAIMKAAYLCGVLLYYGMQRLDLVLIGLKLGSVLGVSRPLNT